MAHRFSNDQFATRIFILFIVTKEIHLSRLFGAAVTSGTTMTNKLCLKQLIARHRLSSRQKQPFSPTANSVFSNDIFLVLLFVAQLCQVVPSAMTYGNDALNGVK